MGCIAGLAMLLMATKMLTWLTITRFHASVAVNAVYVAASALMLWTYALAMFTDAGPPQFAVDSRVRAAEDGDGDDDHDTEGASHSSGGYCERCDALKPARVHHCSACRRCVYRMDHHCPWTSNCVGWTNKKFFLLFLIYTSVSTLTFNSTVTRILFASRDDAPLRAVRHDHKAFLQLAWTLSLAIGSILAGYFCFHVWLLRQGKTTLDYITSRPGEFARYPFSLQVRVYFGSNVLLWLLPVAPELDSRLRGRREAQQLML